MVTRCTSWAYVAAVLLLTGVSTATAKYSGGSGTADDPYQIWTAGQMNVIGTRPDDWDKHFKLMADIDFKTLRGVSFNAIGADPSYGQPFSGVFDGNGKTIANVTCSKPGATTLGLFGGVQGSNARIKRLRLTGVTVDAGAGGLVGALAGYLHSGKIIRCHVEGGSISGGYGVGGLVGICNGTIVSCSSSASVSVSDVCGGGLAGENSGVIIRSHSTGQVSARSSGGGLVGASTGTVSDSYSTGKVSATKGVRRRISRIQLGKGPQLLLDRRGVSTARRGRTARGHDRTRGRH
ncbi:MAG: hypothetical protein JW993_13080 [Sedimentisphaerales bacterium]|nr:hypothetical protein [Sedimentisphaerales bacterium]